MLKGFKFIVPSIWIVTSAVAHAGFYAGAGLGSDTVDFAVRSNVYKADPNQPLEFNVINKAHLSATGIFGTLFAGYGGIVKNHFYLAGEVNGNISSTESKSFNHEYVHESYADSSLKIKNSLGISAVPGYQLSSSTLFYGRLGWTNSSIRQQTNDISLANFSKRTNGFRYGIGIQQGLNERYALRLDYSRIDYKKINSSTYDPVGNVNKITSVNPNQQLLEIGLVVNFA